MKASLALIAVLTCAIPAGANAQVASPFTTAAALGDSTLAGIRGGQAGPLTVGNLLSLAKAEEVQSFQWTAHNARVQMDVWWGSAGSEMIADSVRNSVPN